ncbi:hypothetical protein HF521_018206 [Silurus meridionalis]|uniref:Ig-like domain-containing protein n=2 Tax=Silurus meridionalis TaxID=175797 RepID=A0A8T0BIV2_SILME|nr:hypothetical protein HF521_018206 [Silurus meridionalis]
MTFSTVYIVQPGRRRVSAQTLKDATVYQPDKELSVDIGDSATLRCCISTVGFGDIAWFKQPNREKPQIIVSFFRTAGETFYNGFEKSKFIIGRSSARNCFNLTILNTTPSDEAVYYCALTYPSPEFGDGTYLTIKDVTNASETSKPALWDNSVVCEPALDGNSTNINTQEKKLLGLGTALVFCVLLIFSLTYLILRRRKNDTCILNASIENCPELRQESETEIVNYAALQFSQMKPKAKKKKTGLSDDCTYSDVNIK